MLTCIIIEDQLPAQRVIQKYIEDAGNIELKGVFTNAMEAINFLKTAKVDVVFLDLHLPKISGLDFLEIAPKQRNIIFTTAFSDYALKGYELGVVDYLLKPFSFQRFLKAIAKVKVGQHVLPKEPRESSLDYMFLKTGHEYIKVKLSQVISINADGDYTSIITENGKHLISLPLKNWLDKLGSEYFCQVHKSHIVNINYVKKVVGNQIYLTTGQTVPIGRAFKDHFMRKHVNR